MCHSFLIVYYWNDTEFLTLPNKTLTCLWNPFYSGYMQTRNTDYTYFFVSEPANSSVNFTPA
ncbi:TPA_asm: hypothetical protein G0B47_13170 [Salmonella enterica subsp. salamae serovar 48:d:z6]|uniref:Uncharacterized protein n=1 Tax=Salmonella enterica subsp. salamae serovar 48:d:z6 TaxID=1151170 RepID=A0A701VC46_SALER|nr:hypothetical protein [Salmonella enterica subsp. salamae serovar 48:d:z6]